MYGNLETGKIWEASSKCERNRKNRIFINDNGDERENSIGEQRRASTRCIKCRWWGEKITVRGKSSKDRKAEEWFQNLQATGHFPVAKQQQQQFCEGPSWGSHPSISFLLHRATSASLPLSATTTITIHSQTIGWKTCSQSHNLQLSCFSQSKSCKQSCYFWAMQEILDLEMLSLFFLCSTRFLQIDRRWRVVVVIQRRQRAALR